MDGVGARCGRSSSTQRENGRKALAASASMPQSVMDAGRASEAAAPEDVSGRCSLLIRQRPRWRTRGRDCWSQAGRSVWPGCLALVVVLQGLSQRGVPRREAGGGQFVPVTSANSRLVTKRSSISGIPRYEKPHKVPSGKGIDLTKDDATTVKAAVTF